jgi:hypothetical protein
VPFFKPFPTKRKITKNLFSHGSYKNNDIVFLLKKTFKNCQKKKFKKKFDLFFYFLSWPIFRGQKRPSFCLLQKKTHSYFLFFIFFPIIDYFGKNKRVQKSAIGLISQGDDDRK